MAGEHAQLGQLGEQGAAGDGADAGNALQPGGTGAQARLGLDGGGELRVEVGQVLREPGQVGVEAGPERWRGLVAPLLLRHADGEELAAPGDQGVQVVGGGIWARTQRRLDLGGEAREHPGVEAVGLGQDVEAAGEVAHRPRIDHHRRQPGRDERGVHGPLVAAAGLQARSWRAAAPAHGGLRWRGPWACWGRARRPASGAPRCPSDRGATSRPRYGDGGIWVPSHAAPTSRPALQDAGSLRRPWQRYGLWASATGRDDHATERSLGT